METEKININISHIGLIIFLMLRLDGIIDWKWIWIFSPFWIMWIIQACIWIVAVIANAIAEPKFKSYNVPSGSTLVWDSKTNTLYGPWSAEENETE